LSRAAPAQQFLDLLCLRSAARVGGGRLPLGLRARLARGRLRDMRLLRALALAGLRLRAGACAAISGSPSLLMHFVRYRSANLSSLCIREYSALHTVQPRTCVL
jgi:hypothetical protein